jgi:hypothetical protein
MMTLLNPNLMTAIVYLAVIGQIFTISILFADKWYKRKHFLLTKYPPKDYPNLYVQTSNTELKRLKLRKLMDRIIAFISLSIVTFFYLTKTNLEIVSNSILVFAAIQLLPWFLSSYWLKENNLLMAKNFPSTKRKSSFNNRRLIDSVSPLKLILAVLSYALAVFFALTIFLEQLWFDQSYKALLLLLLNTTMVIYLAWLLFISLYGKKRDHFISSEDRLKVIAEKCKTLSSFLIMYSTFIIGIFLIKTFNLDPIYVPALAGLFIQLLFALSVTNSTDKNYDVYK